MQALNALRLLVSVLDILEEVSRQKSVVIAQTQLAVAPSSISKQRTKKLLNRHTFLSTTTTTTTTLTSSISRKTILYLTILERSMTDTTPLIAAPSSQSRGTDGDKENVDSHFGNVTSSSNDTTVKATNGTSTIRRSVGGSRMDSRDRDSGTGVGDSRGDSTTKAGSNTARRRVTHSSTDYVKALYRSIRTNIASWTNDTYESDDDSLNSKLAETSTMYDSWDTDKAYANFMRSMERIAPSNESSQGAAVVSIVLCVQCLSFVHIAPCQISHSFSSSLLDPL